MLPPICIICRKDKYLKSGTRSKEGLSKVQTLQGGRLLEAARAKQRTDILVHLEGSGRDLVALEARYHHSCYMSLTRPLTKEPPPLQPESLHYTKSFNAFCEAVVKPMIASKNIELMTKLKNQFIKMAKKVEGVNIPNYRAFNLKQRLRRTFPQLEFASTSSLGDIVFCSGLQAAEIVQHAVHVGSETDTERSTDTDTDETSESEEDSNHPLPSRAPTETDDLRTNYYSSQIVRNALTTTIKKARSESHWPPTADHLNIKAAQHLVPHELFNWLAWTTGLSDDPTASEHVTVGIEEERKILSIAQDILYLKAKGRIQTPKHIALSMTVRHLTGSSQLIEMLNGLGHSTSHSFTLEHDTALAQQQLLLGPLPIPPGIQTSKFTTLVWDNIDFGEETLSGSGTTHSTNGIIIQRSAESDLELQPLPSMRKTKRRSLPTAPVMLEPYYGTSKHKDGPGRIGQGVDVQRDDNLAAQSVPKKVDHSFMLARLPSADINTPIPSWTGFNTLLVDSIPKMSIIRYLPVIDATPTKMETVKTILTRSLEYADKLKLDVVVLVFDQAIYAKAQKIRWEDNDEKWRKRLVVRLGGFHTKMSYLSAIGVRFKAAGLSDIFVESGLVASGSINGVMSGHHFNRSVRAHKITSEALQRLRWQYFLDNATEDVAITASAMITRLKEAYPHQQFKDVMESEEFNDLMASYEKFIATEIGKNPNFALWSSYIDMVEDLLLFTRATRTGNWPLHLSAVRSMLPWFFAYNRTNYARYLSAYYLEMCDLPQTHPAVYQQFLNGEFCVQRQQEHGFSEVECDITIEQTCNRDSKTKGGLTGITQHKAAVNRWVLSQPARAAISRECKDMAGQSQEVRIQKELSKTRIAEDEDAIQKVMSTITSMVNPFTEDTALLQLSSGVVADPDIAYDLLNARREGEQLFVTFAQERLQSENVKFSAALKKRTVKTFGNQPKKNAKAAGKEVVLKADRKLFARLILVGNSRKIELQAMLTYNLGPLPLAIASVHGTILKPNKAALLHHVEKQLDEPALIDDIPVGSVWIIDGMAMLQGYANREIPSKFGLFAQFLLSQIVGLATRNNSSAIHFVTDRYPDISIKGTERSRRAATGSERIHIYSPDQPSPRQWSKFLANGQNKESLVSFLFEEWLKVDPMLLRGVTVFFAHGEECHAFRGTADGITATPIPSLRCNHEEADTRMLLHAQYAAERAPSVIIKSLDTDVFIIALGVSQHITSQFLPHTGKGVTVRTIDLHDIRQQVGVGITNALPGLHALTGCDSVSGMYGKGKVRAAKLVYKSEDFQKTMEEVGTSVALTDDLFERLQIFICHLYGQKTLKKVNEARYNMFRLGTHSEQLLPPTEDSLKKHLMRANYQAAVWRRSLEPIQDLPGPVGNGWLLTDGVLEVDWADLPPAPDSVLKTVQCSCKKGGCSSSSTGEFTYVKHCVYFLILRWASASISAEFVGIKPN